MSQARTYRDRRDALMAQCGEGLLLVRGRAAEGVNPSFVYLTGIDEPSATLLMSSDEMRHGVGRASPGASYVHGRKARQLLFLPPSNPLAASWGEDARATIEGTDPASAAVDGVLSTEMLEPLLASLATEAGTLHYVRADPLWLGGEDGDETRFLNRLRSRLFALRMKDATPRVHEMRSAKDAQERSAITRAAGVTAEGFRRVLSMLRAGMLESEVEGELTRCYRSLAATHAFAPIIAAGMNAVYPHYKANASRIAAGELLLVDSGAKLDGYCSDVTRTFPVDGRFNERQRRVYELVLKAQVAAIEHCRVGALLGDIHARAFEVIEAGGFGANFIHGTSHHLGLEVHDAGDVHRPLPEGAVVTVEPGIYLPDEAIGVRIEDDVAITADGPHVLTADIPKDVAALEQLMA